MYEVRKTNRLQDLEKELNKAEREGWALVKTHALSLLGGRREVRNRVRPDSSERVI